MASLSEVGKVVGGTKGNPVLEYISGAPNKPIVIEDEPNIFDYDQLTKYGFDVSRCRLVSSLYHYTVVMVTHFVYSLLSTR